jgi:hypothetical protein
VTPRQIVKKRTIYTAFAALHKKPLAMSSKIHILRVMLQRNKAVLVTQAQRLNPSILRRYDMLTAEQLMANHKANIATLFDLGHG